MALARTIADFAETLVDTLTQTDYRHRDRIDAAAGVYICDCSGFVGYVLGQTAESHFGLVLKETGRSRPRAFSYYDYFASLTPESGPDWRRVDFLADARRGDIVAWRFPTIEKGRDTGHVVFLAETPTLDASGAFYVARVYDSAAKAHFDDTRPSPKGDTGVGSGVLRFKLDGAGRPIAYLFAPPATAQYSYRPIAIGRAL